MLTLCIKLKTEHQGRTQYYAVARTKKALAEWRKKYEPLGIVEWRFHDGSGWADGSPDAWKTFQGIVGVLAEICI